MSIDWADLRLFLDVARLGGLSAATTTTGLSAATLGRRVTALEKQVGEALIVRSHTGNRLTGACEEMLHRTDAVELEAAGGGLSVLPCFAGDSDTRLVRVATPIDELLQEQWLVTHQDERHTREVRLVIERIVALLKTNAPLFNGEVGNPP